MTQQLNLNSIVNLGLPADLSNNFRNPEVKALAEATFNSLNNLLRNIEQYCGMSPRDPSLWAVETPSDTLYRQNLGRFYGKASENIAVGAVINIFNNAGVVGVRNANSSTAKPAAGYCNVSTGVLAGAYGEFILSQGLMPIAGINPGDRLFLSAVNGLIQVGPDVTAGHIEQFIGLGIASGIVYVDITLGTWIQH